MSFGSYALNGKKVFSPLNVPSDGFVKLLKEHEHQIQGAIKRTRPEKNRVGKTLKVHNQLKTDAARQRLEKAMVGKVHAQASETKTNLVYSGPSCVPSNYKAQLLEEHDRHIQKLAKEARPETIVKRFLDCVTGPQVYSGPQVVPSYSVDQLLEQHDHQIQESVQKLSHEKRASKIVVQEKQIKDLYVASVPMFVSGINVDDLLGEHDRQTQECTQRWRLEKKKAYKV